MSNAERGAPTVVHTEPDWVTHAVWWQIYPLGFVGAPQQHPDSAPHDLVEHRLDRVIAWFDYAIELGASGIALGPIFQSETHGYDTTDYYSIDTRLGDENDFRRLIDEAHARGLRVLLDGVFNHVGRSFPQFQQALAEARQGDEADVTAASAWFTRTDSGQAAAEPEFASFEGHSALVALNHSEPAVADFVVDVMNHWLDLGADGWRLDAAYAVPTTFWATVLPRVREAHPDAYIVGEVLHGDYAEFVAESGVDAVTQYELWKATWSGISESNFFELAWSMDRHSEFVASFAPLTFVGNHDVTRIASAIDDSRHLPHALVVLFTVGGTPTIYYGDEQAFTGIKEERFGGDDAIRPEFPSGGRDELAVEGWPIFHVHQELIGLRRRHPWLHRAVARTLQLTNGTYAYELTSAETPDQGHGSADATGGTAAAGSTTTASGAPAADGESLVVSLNLEETPSTLELPARAEVVAGTATVTPTGSGSTISTPAHGWAVLQLGADAR